ncbi:MAG TPA: AAA family ATPase, partial [Blastocatellia bacterium]|nr:AAA family ATPase [Blastocatellia bacterium]
MTRGSTIQQFERAFDPSMEVHLPERPATVASRGEVVTPYANSWEYLCDKLRQLDLRIERELLQMGLRHPVNPLEQFKGLVVSEEEVAALIARDGRSAIPGEADGTHSSALEACTARLDKKRQDIQARLQLTEETGTKLSLLWLACLLGLTPFEQECVLICFAPELDRKYEKLYAYLQDDVTRKKATLDLILTLAESGTDQVAARNSFTAQAPLLKYGLIQVTDHSPDGQAPLLSRALKLDDRIVNFLLELPQLDGRLESVANLSLTSRPGDEVLVNHSIRQRLLELLHKEVAGNENAAGRVCVHLHGPGGSGKHASMRALARELGLPPLLADAGRIAAGGLPLEQTALLLGREALLQPALLCIDNLDALLAGESAQQNQLRTLIQTAFNFTRVAVVISR